MVSQGITTNKIGLTYQLLINPIVPLHEFLMHLKNMSAQFLSADESSRKVKSCKLNTNRHTDTFMKFETKIVCLQFENVQVALRTL